MQFIHVLQIKKKKSMKTMNKDYAVFYAKFAKSTASAWLLEDICLDEGMKEVVINKSYFPKSKLDFSVHSKTKKTIRCVVPEWLWIAKMEEAEIYNPASQATFDQFEKLFSADANGKNTGA